MLGTSRFSHAANSSAVMEERHSSHWAIAKPLAIGGEGMIASAAGGFIRPALAKLDGRTFSLMALSLGSIRLRDLQLRGGDSLRLTAQFGSDASPTSS